MSYIEYVGGRGRVFRFRDKSGDIHGELTVLRYAGRCPKGVKMWLCMCSCGTNLSVRDYNLMSNHTTSCGCIQKVGKETHGQAYHPDYAVWRGMVDRCERPDNKKYHRYGGRGISVCEAWHDPSIFFKDMGKRPKGMSVDRIDNNGNYEPSNCRWATNIEQANNKSNNRMITYKDITDTLAGWGRRTGVKPANIASRIDRLGWPVAKALGIKLNLSS